MRCGKKQVTGEECAVDGEVGDIIFEVIWMTFTPLNKYFITITDINSKFRSVMSFRAPFLTGLVVRRGSSGSS